MSETGTLISHNGKIKREELAQVPTPAATHRPVPHQLRQAGIVAELRTQHGQPSLARSSAEITVRGPQRACASMRGRGKEGPISIVTWGERLKRKYPRST